MALEVFAQSAVRDGICIGANLLHAGIVQEANLSMLHLASNKASEQHTLWQVWPQPPDEDHVLLTPISWQL